MRFALLTCLALASTGCFFTPAPPRVAVPEDSRASATLDPLLPQAWALFEERTPNLELLWMANIQSDWKYWRNPISGVLETRTAAINYAVRQGDRCVVYWIKLRQEHIDGTEFSPALLDGAVLTSDGAVALGEIIDCAAPGRAAVGYRGESGAAEVGLAPAPAARGAAASGPRTTDP